MALGSEGVSILRKLKVLNLRGNYFNESIITTLAVLPSLKSLDLSSNQLSGSFPSQDLSHLTNLENLDLSHNMLNVTPSMQGCKNLMILKKLESVTLGANYFNKSILSCLSFLPSLEILDLSHTMTLGRSVPMQELSSLRELKTLDLSFCVFQSLTLNGTMNKLVYLDLYLSFFNDEILWYMSAFPSLRFLALERCALGGRLFANGVPNLPDLEVLLLGGNRFNGTLPMEALASFQHLEILDLGYNNYVRSIPSTIKLLSSLKVVSFSSNMLNGSLPAHEFCVLKNLRELDLSLNMFEGNLPGCFSMLSSLKFLDISFNQFTGILQPSLISSLTSLEYIDFSHNKFEGSFSFTSFSNHTKLEFVAFISDNDKFEMETEEQVGWTPKFQLRVLVLSNCNINKHKGSIVPNFLLHQHKLKKLDMSRNSLLGQFPDWLIKNNTMMEVVDLSDNLFDSTFPMSFYRNPNTRWLDISGNQIIGAIPRDIQKSLPSITYLNLSRNYLDGIIPSSVGDLSMLNILDLSHNKLSGEVPTGLFTNLPLLNVLKLSNNNFHGEVLSGNMNLSNMRWLQLDSNCFTGKIGNMSSLSNVIILDISNNFFTGLIPNWISNMSTLPESLLFLDISYNYFSGPIPSWSNLQKLVHLHLGSNRFTGSIPDSFGNLTKVLTLDIGNNYLSGKIPIFLGELSSLRILLLGKNNFSGSIPKQLCKLANVSLIDLSSNFLTGSIPGCLQNINGPSCQAFMHTGIFYNSDGVSSYRYRNVLNRQVFDEGLFTGSTYNFFKIQDEVLFTTKTLSLTYKGDVLDIMSGFDLSSNKLTGNIPEELGLLTHIHALNLSHNQLTGIIPVKFSRLSNIESLDLSFNKLTGRVPSELIKLSSLAVFNVSYNNLSGRLPEMRSQFGTFTKDSYKGNSFLCGPPLENKCMKGAHENHSATTDGSDEKWYDLDMTSFYGSFGSTWFVFMLGFAAILYLNPYWRRRWLHLVEECMYTCYYFFYDSARKVFILFFK